MQRCDQMDRASLFAAGRLNGDQAIQFEEHLRTCSSCAEAVRESSEQALTQGGSLLVAAPPASVRERLLSETALPRGVVALVRGQHVNWQETPFEGVFLARLYEDPARGELTSLVRMLPGARYPSHRHASLEHCYVIEGDLVFEDHSLQAGDYSAGSPDKDHSAATTRHGCLLFIVNNSADQVHVN